ncbi:MAG: ribose-5-phosphate isomerase RpiA [Phycisphaeraceae bacterium]|nr:MAG: ribose-5-phosphate isomerase RpiA [Phycisphaeraceae bacterium]
MSERDELAMRAVETIESGMVVGLGTGRAAMRGVRALAGRVRAEGLKITGVATSLRTAQEADELGIPLESLSRVDRVDCLFDGADEVDGSLRMIKGGGAAMTREKIVARMSERRVYLVQEAKLVRRLGEQFPVPVEVLACASRMLERLLRDELSLEATVRRDRDGRIVRTDDMNPVLDVALGDLDEEDLEGLGAWLDSVPGVVGHGLFLDEADEVLVENEAGQVRALTRQE